MNECRRSARAWSALLASAWLACGLAGCGGGSEGAKPPAAAVDSPTSGIATGTAGLSAASALTITVNQVSIAGAPVVEFTVANEAGNGMTGLAPADLRFNIAKLVPGADGGPAQWQNYINRARSGAVQGSQERAASGYAFGKLEGLGSGRYRYRFATDITDPAANPCPTPCSDAAGKALDIRYEPGLTHRVTIQQANAAYPEATGVRDFVPAGGDVVALRDIVATATCNSCHEQLQAHGTRVDTRLCVTCHNPGSSVAGSPPTTVDFQALVHRIHYNAAGAALPSVRAGTPYTIGSTDFSSVVFTQDARHCARCHDAKPAAGTTVATPQGDHWKTTPSIQACGSCHDDVYFGSAPDPLRPYQTKPHSGGVMSDNGTCASCHAAGRFTDAKNIVVAHDDPARLAAAAARFSLNILGVTSVAPGARPVVTFSVTDPTQGDAPYDIKTAPAFTAGGASTLSVKFGWPAAEFANDGSGAALGQPASVNALSAAVPGAAAGTWTVTSPVALPAGLGGTLRVMMDGHPAGDVTTPGSFTDRLQVKSTFRDVAVTGAVQPRRVVADIAKCNTCHGVLSLHGNNRTDEIGVCTVCHNANATDAGRRPSAGGVLSGGVDGKAEESIDFKTMIHGIHAGQAGQGGMRTKGIVVYGFGGSVNDFSGVAFPGRLADCATCHAGDSYRLDGLWAAPTSGGILGSTVASGASLADAADNVRLSPTVAVCSSCHDGDVARLHMQDPASGGSFAATQAALNSTVVEGCTLCHGAGRVFDVKTVHRVR